MLKRLLPPSLFLFLLFSAGFIQAENYRGFQITRKTYFPEIESQLTEAIHEATGLQVLHIQTPDQENLFSITFKTPPTSSNGAPHVLEHSLFGGSENYPLSSVLPMLKRRSLAINMNAGTAPDITFYYASSQVQEDFYNLFQVYLDAVFHPLLKPLTFAREGHRLEFADPNDPTSPLEYKGIVYNEMKGALSSPHDWLNKEISAEIFPDTHYRFNSGGSPEEIPSLTYDELLSFYKSHYHPGNCLIFFHGDIPLEQHLDFLSSQNLDSLPQEPPLPESKKQPRFTQKVSKELFYPSVDEKGGCIISFTWLTSSMQESSDVFALSVLDDILMGSDIGILKEILISSGLCTQASSQLGNYRSEVTYTLRLEGCKAEDADFLEQTILQALEAHASKTIDKEFLDLLDIALHKLEVETSEIGQGHFPIDSSPFFRCVLAKSYGAKPEDGLALQSRFEELRQLTKNPSFYRDLILKHLVKNSHHVRLIAKPSTALANEMYDREQKKLESIKKSLSQDEVERILSVSQELRSKDPEDASSLPQISKDWISTTGAKYDLIHSPQSSFELFFYPANTHQITYADLVFDLPEMSLDELWFARLYACLLSKVGTVKRSYTQSLKYISKYTGGALARFALMNDQPKLVISGNALDRNAMYLFRIFYYMMVNPNFTDKKRLKEQIFKECLRLENSLQNDPLSFAVHATTTTTSSASLSYYQKIKDLRDHFDDKIDDLIVQLQKMQESLLSNGPPHLVICCDQATLDTIYASDFGGLVHLPVNKATAKIAPLAKAKGSSFAYQIASPVAFTAQSFKTVPYTHPDSAFLTLASYLFTNKVLRERVREEGGAYGSAAVYSPQAADFTFYAFRDPQLATTLKAFSEAIDSIASGNFTETDVEEAKLEAIQHLDRPIPPGRRAWYSYAKQAAAITESADVAFRTKLLTATKTDVEQAVSDHIVPGYKEGHTVTFAGKELIERDTPKLTLYLPLFAAVTKP